MSWKFNPPPGWPEQPEGWQPPPGWTPDPSWPPAPAGWQFWVPATSTPQPAPPAAEPAPSAGPPGSPASPGSPTVHEAPTAFGGTYPVNPQSGSGYPGTGQPAASYPTSPYASGAPETAYFPGSAGTSYQPGAPQQPGTPYQPATYQPGTTYQPGSPHQPGTSYPPGPGAPGPRKPWHQQWWAIGGTALAVLLVGCLGGTAVALITEPGDDTDAPPASQSNTASPTPDDTGGESSGSGGLPVGEERSGQGPTIIPLDLPAESLHTVTLSFSGEGFFAARLVDSQGEPVGSLASSSGDYSGVFPVELGKYGEPDALDITDAADGSWTVLVEDLADAPVWPEVTEGTGDVVLQIDPGFNQTAVSGSHDGESNFIVWAHSETDYEDRLLFNQIGEFSGNGEDEVVSESVLIHVQADGDWTLAPA